MVVKQLIEADLDSIFLPDSYGYRPRKSALDALRRTRKWPSRGAWGRQSLQTGLSCHREGKGETSFATTSEPDTLLSSAAMSFRTAMSRHPPIVHKDDHTIRSPMFCSVLPPVLRKEREDRLAAAGYVLEWADIVHDPQQLIETEAEQGPAGTLARPPHGPSAAAPPPRFAAEEIGRRLSAKIILPHLSLKPSI